MRLSYLATRFPATYAAVLYVLAKLPPCQKILDLGAGPATASLAALELWPDIDEITLIEKSLDAISLGKQLLSHKNTTWLRQDLASVEKFPAADLAIFSYSLGELQQFEPLLDRLKHIPMIAIIEPGTPFGYRNILRARSRLLELGFALIAPCPHAKPCPLKGDNWCHFSTRLERTKLHRFLKEGSRGFEDEKFSYLVVSFRPIARASGSRILRHPQKGSGHVRLVLCTPDGTEEELVVSRKDKELYKAARDAEWGASF